MSDGSHIMKISGVLIDLMCCCLFEGGRRLIGVGRNFSQTYDGQASQGVGTGHTTTAYTEKYLEHRYLLLFITGTVLVGAQLVELL
jgi:hypothetical protein